MPATIVQGPKSSAAGDTSDPPNWVPGDTPSLATVLAAMSSSHWTASTYYAFHAVRKHRAKAKLEGAEEKAQIAHPHK